MSNYTGEYRFAPFIGVTITEEADALYAQVSGFPRSQIYPSATDEYYFKEVNVQIRFNRDSSGRVVDLVMVRDGHKLPRARRVGSAV